MTEDRALPTEARASGARGRHVVCLVVALAIGLLVLVANIKRGAPRGPIKQFGALHVVEGPKHVWVFLEITAVSKRSHPLASPTVVRTPQSIFACLLTEQRIARTFDSDLPENVTLSPNVGCIVVLEDRPVFALKASSSEKIAAYEIGEKGVRGLDQASFQKLLQRQSPQHGLSLTCKSTSAGSPKWKRVVAWLDAGQGVVRLPDKGIRIWTQHNAKCVQLFISVRHADGEVITMAKEISN